MPEVKVRYGDCPICGKGVVYEGGKYCGPTCWGYATPVVGDRSTASVPALGTVIEEKPKPAPPQKDRPAASPPARTRDLVPKKKKAAPVPEPLPDLGSEDDEPLGFLMSLED